MILGVDKIGINAIIYFQGHTTPIPGYGSKGEGQRVGVTIL